MIDLKKFGPGLMVAALSIGTSHLIQSTRAGVNFGLDLLWISVLINIIKYPFIQYGVRYYYSTGDNLISGYKKLGRNFLVCYFFTSIVGAFTAIAALGYVTAGVIKFIFDVYFPIFSISINSWNIIIILLCVGIKLSGGYNYISKIIKFLMLLLIFTTSITFIVSIYYYGIPDFNITHNHNTYTWANLAFIIALMGWMPGPVDLSIYYSIWRQERSQNGEEQNETSDNYDFNFGYVITIITAVMFMFIGAAILHNKNIVLSNSAVVFAGQFISLFTTAIGAWTFPIMALCALSAIFSTCLTLIDIYPQTVAICFKHIFPKIKISLKKLYIIIITIVCIANIIFISLYVQNFKILIDVATITAFLSSPFVAIMNYMLVTKHVAKKYKPGMALQAFSIFGIFVMSMTGIIFLIQKFIF